MADAFETLIEMWNEEKSKKKKPLKNICQPLQTRKRGGTIYSKSDIIDKKGRFKEIRENSISNFNLYEKDECETIKLNSKSIKSKKKKKCC